MVQFDGFKISQARLVDVVHRTLKAHDESPSLSNKLSSRHIRLPMVFDDKVNRASIERYMSTQRPTASYLPDPVEFIARSNGLKSKQEVLDKVLSTKILVVGVGFWSGTPIGFPVDPRCRLMVPKFNPSRTFSPAGGLGIGGCFFCCDPTVSFGKVAIASFAFALEHSASKTRKTSTPGLTNKTRRMRLEDMSTLAERFPAGTNSASTKASVTDHGYLKTLTS